MAQQTVQVVGYVRPAVKDELAQIRTTGQRRVSESQLIEEALVIAMPELKRRYPSFDGPAQGAPGRKKKTAA